MNLTNHSTGPVAALPPIDCLPPHTRALVRELHRLTGLSELLILYVVLGCASAAVQRGYRIRRRQNLVSGCGLMLILLARSGRGKTFVSNLLTQSIKAWDQRQAARFDSELREYEGRLAAWKAIKKGLERALASAACQGDDVSEQEARMKEHVAQAPVRPRGRRSLYDDVTWTKLIEGMASHSPQIALLNDEAATSLNGHIARALLMMNRAWDGQVLRFDRVNRDSLTIHDPQITLCWLLQPPLFEEWLKQGGKQARDSGFAARALVAMIRSEDPPWLLQDQDVPWHSPELDRFHARITAILDEADSLPEGQMKELCFADDAHWNHSFNHFNQAKMPGGYLASIPDFAAKAPEHVARLAAVLHVLEGFSGREISAQTLLSAHRLVDWNAEEFVRIVAQDPMRELEEDAAKIEAWLCKMAPKMLKPGWIPMSLLQKRGPDGLRRKEEYEWSINYLIDHNRLKLVSDGRSTCIVLNPTVFSINHI